MKLLRVGIRVKIIVLLALFIFVGANTIETQNVYAAKKGKGRAKPKVEKKIEQKIAEEKAPAPEEKKVDLWNHPGGTLLSTSFSSDGKSAVSVNSEGTIFFWDVETGKKIRSVRYGSKATAATFFGNKQIAFAGGLDKDNAIFMLNLTTGKKTETLAGHKGGVKTLAFSTDGENILSGGWNNQVTLWGGEHGDIVRVFKGHDDVVNSVAFSPDRVLAASGSADGKINVWNMSTGELTQKIKAHKQGVLKVAFSPDGNLILSGGIKKGKGKDKKKNTYPIKLWDVATGKPLAKTNLAEHKEALLIALFSPNGRYVLSGDRSGTSTPNATLKLWDTEAPEIVLPKGIAAPPKEPVRIFEGHAGAILTAAFSPDGTRVLAGGDGTLTIWETETGKLLGGGSDPGQTNRPVGSSEEPPPAGGVPPETEKPKG
jgi:WD40 repeat protein